MTNRARALFNWLSLESLGFPALIGPRDLSIRLEELPAEYLVQIARGMMLVRREQPDDEMTRHFFRSVRNRFAELLKKHPEYQVLDGLENSRLLLAAIDHGARDIRVDRLIGATPQKDLLIQLMKALLP